MSAFRHCSHCLRAYTGQACKCATQRAACDHEHVRYWAAEHGAIACDDCGRLFGHLLNTGTFQAYNPTETA